MSVLIGPGREISLSPQSPGFATSSQQKTLENLMIPYASLSQLSFLLSA